MLVESFPHVRSATCWSCVENKWTHKSYPPDVCGDLDSLEEHIGKIHFNSNNSLLKISYVYIMCFDPIHPLSLPSIPSLSATISLPTSCALSLSIFFNLLSLFSVASMFMGRGPSAGARWAPNAHIPEKNYSLTKHKQQSSMTNCFSVRGGTP